MEVRLPAVREGRQLAVFDPGRPAVAVEAAVDRAGDVECDRQVVEHAEAVEGFRERRPMLAVPRHPGRQVPDAGESVRLPFVAGDVRQDEVVAQVVGVARPGDEVVHVTLRLQGPPAIEAELPLQGAEDVGEAVERRPPRPEEELLDVPAPAQDVGVPLPHEAHPGAAREIDDELVVPAEAEGDAREEGDARAAAGVGVEELDDLPTHPLQLPEWLLADHDIYRAHELAPPVLAHGVAKGVAESRLPRAHDPGDCLAFGACAVAEEIGALEEVDLPPVVAGEAFGDRPGRQFQGVAGVVAALEGEVGKGEEEGVLVGGDEVALGEDALELREEVELRLGGGEAHQYFAFPGTTHLTPPRGSSTSPFFRGITWICAWSTVCPAAAPALIPMLNPSGASSRASRSRTRPTSSSIARCSSPLSANTSASCRRGTTSVCPGATGNPSGIAAASAFASCSVGLFVRSQRGQVTLREYPKPRYMVCS